MPARQLPSTLLPSGRFPHCRARGFYQASCTTWRPDLLRSSYRQRRSALRKHQLEKEITMQDKPVALVTGANQGIGLQIAKDLAAHGFTVLVGSRNLERGEAAVKEVGPDARALQLDVTDQASIAAAAERIRKEFGRLDVLVNNAAISHTGKLPGTTIADFVQLTRPSIVSLDEVRAVWETNVFGVLAVYQAMLALLREAPEARIVNVSSGVGFTKTNLNNYEGTETVEEGACEAVRVVLLGP